MKQQKQQRDIVKNYDKLLIACSMMKKETAFAMFRTGTDIPIIWMDRGLHNNPEKMRKTLQEVIDENQQYKNILLAYGQCGNGTRDLMSENSKVIIPNFHDCIDILRETPSDQSHLKTGTFYLTSGWIDSSEYLFDQVKTYKDKYGEEKAQYVIDMMFGGYDKVAFIDTGAYDIGDYRTRVQEDIKFLNLNITIESGSLQYLEKLFLGQWDDDFIILEPIK